MPFRIDLSRKFTGIFAALSTTPRYQRSRPKDPRLKRQRRFGPKGQTSDRAPRRYTPYIPATNAAAPKTPALSPRLGFSNGTSTRLLKIYLPNSANPAE
jgi:hypothetical protein